MNPHHLPLLYANDELHQLVFFFFEHLDPFSSQVWIICSSVSGSHHISGVPQSGSMEMIKLGLITALILTNVFCQELDADSWRARIEETKWPNTDVIRDFLVEMTRNPRLRQHFSLRGKKGCGKTSSFHHWHKFQTFVGLMGKRRSDYEGAL
ncbi:protachykinin-like [Nothobranchius furzeri]|uniref:Protachykinin-like n=1 Tax=Nothobranchius furzeri TaxID=105023 RepID=A0A9D2YTA1_NOTFU|nr:protachykinin-like [Nothobranchius furzeri]